MNVILSLENKQQKKSFIFPFSGIQYDLIRNEAITLVDSVLDESVCIVNNNSTAQLLQQNNVETLCSESENFAITCDINGVDLIKSPTIESMSGKSFDDNISVSDIDIGVNNYSIHHHPINHNNNNNITCNRTTDERSTSSVVATTIDDDVKTAKKYERIERKFERLSSQLDPDDIDNKEIDFEQTIQSNVNPDELSNLQSDFSKISWDESVSATTADMGLGTPDNDIQDLPKGDC